MLVEVEPWTTLPQEVTVLGAVANPQRMVGGSHSLASALAAAGPRPGSDLSRIEIREVDGSYAVANLFDLLGAQPGQGGLLKGQVALLVPAGPPLAVQVLGGVERAGPVAWAAGLTVADALRAAGLSPGATVGTVLATDGTPRRVSLSLEQAGKQPLAPGEILVVGPLPLAHPQTPWREVLLAAFTKEQVERLLGG